MAILIIRCNRQGTGEGARGRGRQQGFGPGMTFSETGRVGKYRQAGEQALNSTYAGPFSEGSMCLQMWSWVGNMNRPAKQNLIPLL